MKDTTKELNEVVAAAHAGDKLHKLAGQIIQLQTADKLRLAASLLDLGLVEQAIAVGTRGLQEIELARLFAQPAQRRTGG